MTKQEFLKELATTGYNIGFGAKKNFSSFDLINKLPTWFGIVSLFIGLCQLGFPDMPCQKTISILLIVASVSLIYMEFYKSDVTKYEEEGKRLTELFNKTRQMYFSVKDDSQFVYGTYKADYENLMSSFYSNSISKQVFMSQWYAHIKFFGETQIDWMDEQLKFRFFKDKVPGSLKAFFLILIFVTVLIFIGYGCCKYFQ